MDVVLIVIVIKVDKGGLEIDLVVGVCYVKLCGMKIY